MKKEIVIQFAAQSKAVVEKVEIKYYFEDSETFLSNEQILEECKQLHSQASRYARDETFKRSK